MSLGFKNFLFCSFKGIVYDMLLCQGNLTEIVSNFFKKYGLSASVVLKLIESLQNTNIIYLLIIIVSVLIVYLTCLTIKE